MKTFLLLIISILVFLILLELRNENPFGKMDKGFFHKTTVKECKRPWSIYDQMVIQRKGGAFGIPKKHSDKNESSRERNRNFTERFAKHPKYHSEIRFN